MPASALFARTFLIGIAVAAPVGAMGVLCIQRTLDRGWRAGIATGAGIATADGMYASVAAFGVAALSSALVSLQTPLRLVGGAFLVYLGVRSMMVRTDSVLDDVSAPRPDGRGLAMMYGSAVGLTLTNPMTIMAFGAVFASAGLVAAPGLVGALWATVGIAAGSLFWWLVLVAGTSMAHAAVGSVFGRWVSRISGALIAAMGLIAMGSVVLR